MNLYILVEGRQTERKLYPVWLSYALPDLKKIQKPELAQSNNYYLLSGEGWPSILKHAEDAIKTVNDIGNVYDYLVVAVDSEGTSVKEKKEKVVSHLQDSTPIAVKTKLEVIVQHPCIETWLLGNKRNCPRNPVEKELSSCLKFYDIINEDPELMGKPPQWNGTIANYHEYFLKNIFRDGANGKLTYSKTNPGEAAKPYYWDAMVERYTNDNHISSFGLFLHFLKSIGSI